MSKVLPVIALIILSTLLFLTFQSVTIVTDISTQGAKEMAYLDDDYKPEIKVEKKEANNWSTKKKKVKGVDSPDQPDMFVKFHNEIRTPKNENSPLYEAGYQVREFTKAKGVVNRLGKTTDLDWVERGPGNVGGRTRALIIDPNDATHKTWFAGAVSGGIWKTTNEGETWTEIAPDIPNMAVTCLAMSGVNKRTIYAGTGEGFYNSDATNGNGIFKSTDRGANWKHLESTINNKDFENINRIIVDPNNENVLYACYNNGFWKSASDRSSGIHKSINGGKTWKKVYSGSNRVQQIVADPDDFSVLYATENGLGVLKSVDAGNTWVLSSNGITAGARFELAIAPNNTNRLYLGAEASPSILYYSDDAGANWIPTIDTDNGAANWLGAQGWYNNTLVVHPFDQNTVYLGGINLWKATLGTGTTPNAGITDVSENGTQSFLDFTNWGGGFARGGLDIGTYFFGSTDLVAADYTSVEFRFGPGVGQKGYRYVRNGATGVYEYKDFVDVPMEVWDIDNNVQLTVSFRDAADNGVLDFGVYATSASWREYIFANAVPYTEVLDTNLTKDGAFIYKNIYAFWPMLPEGGTWDADNLPESNLRVTWEVVTQQNATFTRLSNWYAGQPHPDGGVYPFVHADHHNLQAVVTNFRNQQFLLVDGNDGGVEYSKDGGTIWNKTLNGYVTTQFYGIDKKPGANEYIGGLQDNGSWQSAMGEEAHVLTEYTNVLSGDGYEVSWHADNPDMLIGSLYNTRPYKSTDGGYSWSVANNGLTDYNNGPFITSFGTTKSDPDLIFTTGPSGVWRSDNFADSWSLSAIDENWSFQGTKTNIAVSIADPQVVWSGSYLDEDSNIFVSEDGGLSFNAVTPDANSVGRVTNIETDPIDKNTAYLIFSFAKSPKIIKTTDLGQTWVDITGFEDGDVSTVGFPDVAVYSLLVMPYDTDIMWAGTEIGIFETLDGGASWALADNGFPSVHVWMMKIVDGQIVVGTHGRGIWTVDIPELADYTAPVVVKSPRLDGASQSPTGDLVISTSLRSQYDSTKILFDGEVAFSQTATKAGYFTFHVPITESATHETRIISYKDGVEYKSSPLFVNVYQLAEPVEEYVNDLNGQSVSFDFAGDALHQANYDEFSSIALHSEHPYVSNLNATERLLIPIAISSSDAVLRYKDIAIIEPGDASGFWDYVVVEGTSDGVNWIPLLDEYDANLYDEWFSAYDSGVTPDSSMFKSHSITLSDFFDIGDIVLLRFRMFTDSNTEGWGWVVDDISITQTVTGVEDGEGLPVSFELSQNYPNPFNPSTTIKFALPQASNVKVVIYDAIGQQVKSLVSEALNAGYHTIQWNASNVSSGIYFYRIEAGDFVETKKMMLLK